MPMQRIDQSLLPATEPVLVYHGDETEGVPQPSGFCCCLRGVQLLNRRPVPLYELVEFKLDFPSKDGSAHGIDCVGIIADCRHDPSAGLYRISVRFLDLPSSARRRLASLTHRDYPSCPFCENS